MILAEISADIEKGLTIWSDGDGALAPCGEPYVTFVLGRVIGGQLNDGDLIERMHQELIQYRKVSRGRFISWRKRLAFEDNKSILPGGLAPTSVQKSEGAQRLILDPEVMVRDLRCRVLITHYETAEQREHDIMAGTRSRSPNPPREEIIGPQ